MANIINLNLTYSNVINQSKFLYFQSFTNTKLPTTSEKSPFIQSPIPISNSINEKIYNTSSKPNPDINVKKIGINTTISNKDINSQTVNYLFTKSSRNITGEKINSQSIVPNFLSTNEEIEDPKYKYDNKINILNTKNQIILDISSNIKKVRILDDDDVLSGYNIMLGKQTITLKELKNQYTFLSPSVEIIDNNKYLKISLADNSETTFKLDSALNFSNYEQITFSGNGILNIDLDSLNTDDNGVIAYNLFIESGTKINIKGDNNLKKTGVMVYKTLQIDGTLNITKYGNGIGIQNTYQYKIVINVGSTGTLNINDCKDGIHSWNSPKNGASINFSGTVNFNVNQDGFELESAVQINFIDNARVSIIAVSRGIISTKKNSIFVKNTSKVSIIARIWTGIVLNSGGVYVCDSATLNVEAGSGGILGFTDLYVCEGNANNHTKNHASLIVKSYGNTKTNDTTLNKNDGNPIQGRSTGETNFCFDTDGTVFVEHKGSTYDKTCIHLGGKKSKNGNFIMNCEDMTIQNCYFAIGIWAKASYNVNYTYTDSSKVKIVGCYSFLASNSEDMSKAFTSDSVLIIPNIPTTNLDNLEIENSIQSTNLESTEIETLIKSIPSTYVTSKETYISNIISTTDNTYKESSLLSTFSEIHEKETNVMSTDFFIYSTDAKTNTSTIVPIITTIEKGISISSNTPESIEKESSTINTIPETIEKENFTLNTIPETIEKESIISSTISETIEKEIYTSSTFSEIEKKETNISITIPESPEKETTITSSTGTEEEETSTLSIFPQTIEEETISLAINKTTETIHEITEKVSNIPETFAKGASASSTFPHTTKKENIISTIESTPENTAKKTNMYIKTNKLSFDSIHEETYSQLYVSPDTTNKITNISIIILKNNPTNKITNIPTTILKTISTDKVTNIPSTIIKNNPTDKITNIPTTILKNNPTDKITNISTIIPKSIPTEKLSDSPVKTKVPKLLPRFKIESINQEECPSTKELIFFGSLSSLVKEKLEFTIMLSYPKDIEFYCYLNENYLKCESNRIIYGNEIFFEETTITKDNEEIMVIEEFESKEKIYCGNYDIEKAKQKILLNIAFRQVSHFRKNDNDNSFSFYLITMMSDNYNKGHIIDLKMLIQINNKMFNDKNATCILEQDVFVHNDGFAQGNFLCYIKLTHSEYQNTAYENITVSRENEEIIGDLDFEDSLLNPYITDKKIEEVKRKRKENYIINSLANIFDYYEEVIKIPPIFHINSVIMDNCDKTGILVFQGTFSEDIIISSKFDIILNYPLTEIKCELDEGKRNDIINMTCKVHKGFKNVEALLLESRLIKKRNIELFYVNKFEKYFGKELKVCVDYNDIKELTVRKRIQSPFTFLQINKFKSISNKIAFFMALTRNSTGISFMSSHKISIKLKIFNRRILRNLDENLDIIVQADCELNKNLRSDYAAGYDCSNSDSFKGISSSMMLNEPEIDNIQGIPEKKHLDTNKLNYKVDYSPLENLKLIDSLPTAIIQNINSEKCIDEGQYIIYAKLNKNENLEKNYSNVNISIAVPESSSLCYIKINDKNIEMICENNDKFYKRTMLIERQVIQDSEGKALFFIDNIIIPIESSFYCYISNNSNSKLPEKIENIQDTENLEEIEDNEETSHINHYLNKKRNKNNGLSNFGLAFVIICIVFAIISVIIMVIYIKIRKIKKEKKRDSEISVIQKINIDG